MSGDGLTGEALVRFVIHTGGDAAKLFGSGNLQVDLALKRAYKRMALRLHPDKNPVPGAHEAFQIMQHAFETALEVLQSLPTSDARGTAKKESPPPPPPPPPAASPHWESRGSWAPPPAPPASWPSNNDKRKAPSAGGKPGHRQRESALGDDLFEIPLPPDVFGDFVMPGEARGARNPTQPAPSQPHGRPLPVLTLSSSSSSSSHTNNNDSNAGNIDKVAAHGRATRVNHKFRANMLPNSYRQQPLDRTQRRESSRVTLKQLFTQFNIDDDDDDDDPRGSVKPSGDPVRAVAVVSCPYCGSGGFEAHNFSTVVCSNCRGSFVPHAVGMASAARQAARQKKSGVEPTCMCSCGRAKKGLCFICD